MSCMLVVHVDDSFVIFLPRAASWPVNRVKHLDHLLTMPAVRHGSNRLPLHTARRATVRGVVSVTTSRAIWVRSHGAAGAISSVERSAAPAAALVCTPASLARKHGVVEAIEGACASAVDEGCVAEEGDVVEAEVPDGGVDHAVGGKGHDGTDNGTGEDVVPGDEVSKCF
jgi:hypothetical protein